MDIIKPGDEKKPVDGVDKPGDKPAETPYTLKADLNTPGWMKLEINLDAISQSRQAQWQLMGFFDDHKGIALQIISQLIAQRNEVKKILTSETTKNGHKQPFYSRIFNKR